MDRDGVRIVEGPGARRDAWLALAVGVVTVVVVLVVRLALGQRKEGPGGPPTRDAGGRVTVDAKAVEPAPAGSRSPARVHDAPARAGRGKPRRVRGGDAGPAPSPENGPPGDPDPPRQLTGIAVFPPPGTDPPRPGIVVPDDFELPPGYVRHFQVTDDGRQLPAILMFHPDYEWVDERGEPVAVPADRIVPPEMAPPGLSIQMLEVPETKIPLMEADEGPGDQAAEH